MSNQLTHLRQLEAESIHIIREVAAEFENPVMLYSLGKDSAVMPPLAICSSTPTRTGYATEFLPLHTAAPFILTS